MTDGELRVKRRIYEAQARKNYTPGGGASFETYLSHHMRKLNDDIHNATSTLKSSESVGYDIGKIQRASDEYIMQHGVEPSVSDLKRATGLSEKVINKHLSRQKITAVGNTDFASTVFDVSPNELYQPKDRHEKIMFDAVIGEIHPNDAAKQLGMSKSSLYNHLGKIRSIMRESYLRKYEQHKGS